MGCNGVSGLFCWAYLLLIVASLACELSYVAPFWLLYPETNTLGSNSQFLINGKTGDEWVKGLWGKCVRTDSKCHWFFEDGFKLQEKFPAYHKVSQGLYSGGMVLLQAVILTATPYVCCRLCRRSITITPILGILTLAAIVCITASLAVFGAFSTKEEKAEAVASEGSESPTFYWGYWVSVGGLAAALVASFMLLIDSCTNRDRYQVYGYRPASQISHN